MELRNLSGRKNNILQFLYRYLTIYMQKLKLLTQTLWKYMPPHRKGQFILVLIFSIISRIIWLANPFIIGKLINLVQEK